MTFRVEFGTGVTWVGSSLAPKYFTRVEMSLRVEFGTVVTQAVSSLAPKY